MNQQHPHPQIAMQPVKGSSNVSAIGHDAATNTLEVHFISGLKYRYAGVSQESFTAFLQADSKGAYFARHIRGLHDSTKVVDEPEGKTTNHNTAA